MVVSKSAWILTVALTLINSGFNPQSAFAQSASLTTTNASLINQNSRNFEIKYNTLLTLIPTPDLGENIFRATITGQSSDAAFGLTNFESNTYGKLVEATPTTQKFEFNGNPAVFGLTGQQVLVDRYFGGSNELFGIADDMATVDFAAATVMGGGVINITGGIGIFEQASGQISFTQQDVLDLNAPPGTPVKGEAILKFSVQTPKAVPEPTVTTTLVSIGAIGAVMLRRRHSKAVN
jgi:hypothetical protein